jgi:Ni/Fe-hydrogenase subunit HybB-like protein
MSTQDRTGTNLINHWQRGVPVSRAPLVSPTFLALAALTALGFALAGVRLFSPLGRFAGMNDEYAWGIWKTFNVMTLTALGSGPLALGIAAWVFNRQKLHVVMRTALVSGFLFYATGLIALGFDVGRPWNFWNAALPWRWNAESAMLEIGICMPLYVAIFLSFEILPIFLERFYYTSGEKTRAVLRRVAPLLRRIYPFMLIGAYLLPLMHQSSLGGLLLLAGDKIHPLWQTPFLPLLYLLAAGLCGIGFVIFLLLLACLRYSRPLDLGILDELGRLLCAACFLFLAVRAADLIWRGQLHAAFAFDRMSVIFLAETALISTPAFALLFKAVRQTPRSLLKVATLACLGGMYYRFVPTTVAFHPELQRGYFPTLPELLMAGAYVSLAFLCFGLAVKFFAVLPGDAHGWNNNFRLIRLPQWPWTQHLDFRAKRPPDTHPEGEPA